MIVIMEFMSGKDAFCFPSYCSYWQWQIFCYCILPLAFDIVKRGTVSADYKSIVFSGEPTYCFNERPSYKGNAGEECFFLPSMLATWMKKTPECEVCLGKYQLIFISPESPLSSNL